MAKSTAVETEIGILVPVQISKMEKLGQMNLQCSLPRSSMGQPPCTGSHQDILLELAFLSHTCPQQRLGPLANNYPPPQTQTEIRSTQLFYWRRGKRLCMPAEAIFIFSPLTYSFKISNMSGYQKISPPPKNQLESICREVYITHNQRQVNIYNA